MRPKLLLLALCLCALGVIFGQNGPALVGMPEVGVTLTGTPDQPEIVNNSGRGILGYVILSLDAKGRRLFMPTLKTGDMRWALVRPASASPSGPMPTPPQSSSDKDSADDAPKFSSMGWLSVQAILDAVIFDNGEFRGTDGGQYFVILSGQVDGERSLAQAFLAGRISWEQLEVRTRERILVPEGQPAQMELIQDLLLTRAKFGEAAARKMADWSAKLPVL